MNPLQPTSHTAAPSTTPSPTALVHRAHTDTPRAVHVSPRRLAERTVRFAAALLFVLLGLLPAATLAAPPRAPAGALAAAELPSGCTELIGNGSFEQINQVWFLPPSLNPPVYDNTNAFAGNYSLQLGNVGMANQVSTSRAEQAVALPANATSIILSFRYFGRTDDELGLGADDRQYLDIWDAATNQFIVRQFEARNKDRLWLGAQYSLTAYRGRTVRLSFGVDNDGANARLAMNLDVVSLYYCTSTPTAIPTLTPTWTPTFLPTLFPTPFPTPFPPPTTFPPPTNFPPTQLPPPTYFPPTTPFPPDFGCTNILVNGDFESDAGWIFGPNVLPGQYVWTFRQAGNRAAQLGNPPNFRSDALSFSSMRQLVTIPANSPSARLIWFQLLGTEEVASTAVGIGEDRQDVVLLNPDLSTLAVVARTRRTTGGFEQQVVDMSPYRGRSLYVYFNAFNDGNGRRTWMYVDSALLCTDMQAVPFAAQPAGAQPSGFTAAQPAGTQGQTTVIQRGVGDGGQGQALQPLPDYSQPGTLTPTPTIYANPAPAADAAGATAEPEVQTGGADTAANTAANTAADAEQFAKLSPSNVETLTAIPTVTPAKGNTTTSRTTLTIAALCLVVLIVGALSIGILTIISRPRNTP